MMVLILPLQKRAFFAGTARVMADNRNLPFGLFDQ